MSSFGWTYLSRDALRQAEAQLVGEAAGVRDEIGFLIIHQRYADQFFPVITQSGHDGRHHCGADRHPANLNKLPSRCF